MSTLAITITVSGDKQVQQKMRRLGTSLYDFKNAMNDIGKEAKRYYSSEVFASEGEVIGKQWSPLSTSYRARKAKRYPGKPILVASGRMQRSFTHNATANSVLITNQSPYFKYHQSTRPRTKMPYRPMMAINEPVKRMVRNTIRSEMIKKIKSA